MKPEEVIIKLVENQTEIMERLISMTLIEKEITEVTMNISKRVQFLEAMLMDKK
jgi:hypothetical protein